MGFIDFYCSFPINRNYSFLANEQRRRCRKISSALFIQYWFPFIQADFNNVLDKYQTGY